MVGLVGVQSWTLEAQLVCTQLGLVLGFPPLLRLSCSASPSCQLPDLCRASEIPPAEPLRGFTY